jgi:NADH-quinone oxidoreductase subunit K
MLASIGLAHYLGLAAVLFCLGVLTMITKRNAIGILIGVELVLNAANLNLVAFNRYRVGSGASGSVLLDGQVFALFVIVLAAAEAAVAIAIFMNYYNSIGSVDVDQASRLRG